MGGTSFAVSEWDVTILVTSGVHSPRKLAPTCDDLVLQIRRDDLSMKPDKAVSKLMKSVCWPDPEKGFDSWL